MLPVLIIVILSWCLSYSWTLSRADAVAIELTTEERSDTRRHGTVNTVVQRQFHRHTIIGVNSYWAQVVKPPPTFMIMGLAHITSSPTFVT